VFTWSGWVDDLSKLKIYSYQVFHLKDNGVELWEHRKIKDETMSLSDVSVGCV